VDQGINWRDVLVATVLGGGVVSVITGIVVWLIPTRITPQIEFDPKILFDHVDNRLKLRIRNVGRRSIFRSTRRWGHVLDIQVAATLLIYTGRRRLDVPVSNVKLMGIKPHRKRLLALDPKGMSEEARRLLDKTAIDGEKMDGRWLYHFLTISSDEHNKKSLLIQVLATDAFSGARMYAEWAYWKDDVLEVPVHSKPTFPAWVSSTPRQRSRAARAMSRKIENAEAPPNPRAST